MNWLTTFIPGALPDTTPLLSVLAKRTYRFSPGTLSAVAEEQRAPFIEADIYSDPSNPSGSDIVAESDYVAYKQTTDVVVTGNVCAPRGTRVRYIDCMVQIGETKVSLRMFGKRVVVARPLRGLSFTDPEPFERRELGYRFAYGGYATDKNGVIMSYPPNPIGTGFFLKGGAAEITSIEAPCQEDPDHPLAPDDLIVARFNDWPKAPKPVSLGWTQRRFYPRFTYAQPDPRFFSGASEGLCEKQLTGKEYMALHALHPEFAAIEFELPGDIPEISLMFDGKPVEPAPMLQTVALDTNQCLLTMLWRSSVCYERGRPLEDAVRGFGYCIK